MIANNKILFIGDTHPEMIALAQVYSRQKSKYKVFLPCYFTWRESQIISKLFPRTSRVLTWLQKRTLPPEILRVSVVRPFASLDLLIWFLKRLRLYKTSKLLLILYKKLLSLFATLYLKVVNPRVIVCYDTINFTKPKGAKLIVICTLAHPLSVNKIMDIAKADYPNWPVENNINDNKVNTILTQADELVVFSEYAMSTFVNNGFDTKRIFVINIGPVNGNTKQLDEVLIPSERTFRALFLGQVTLRKGIPAILEASRLLEGRVQFTLAGPVHPNVVAYIETQALTNVKLIPNPHPDELEELFKETNIFVMPSYSEGFSIACLEAMTYGHIPILSSNSGVAELLRESELKNFIIRPGSSSDIVKAISMIESIPSNAFEDFRQVSARLVSGLSMELFASQFIETRLLS